MRSHVAIFPSARLFQGGEGKVGWMQNQQKAAPAPVLNSTCLVWPLALPFAPLFTASRFS